MDAMDRGIIIAIMFFVLSTICERFCNFIKLWLSDSYVFNWLNKINWVNEIVPSLRPVNVIGNMRRPEIDADCEKQRELRILLFNIILGMTTAIVLGIDMHHIFISLTDNKPPETLVGRNLWDSDVYISFSVWMLTLAGTMLAGLFISFGSKFWHDLLDLLFEVKNLKGKLADEATYKAQSAQQLTEYVQLRDADMVDAVYKERSSSLLAIAGVQGIGKGSINNNGVRVPCITVTLLEETPASTIPPLYYDSGTGIQKRIPVEILYATTTEAAVSLAPSDKIGNQDRIFSGKSKIDAYGSFCFPVHYIGYPEELLILTCYHVVRYGGTDGNNVHDWTRFDPRSDNKTVITYDDSTIVAEIIEGVRTSELDVALAKPAVTCKLTNVFAKQTWNIKGYREVTKADQGITRVKLQGGTSGYQEGIIDNYKTEMNVKYPDTVGGHILKNLFSVKSSVSGQVFSKKGDSGSLVLDENNNALGIIVAGNSARSYVIRFTSIVNRFGIDI